MNDLRGLIQQRLAAADTARTEAAALKQQRDEEWREQNRRNARLKDGEWKLAQLKSRLEYARQMFAKADRAINNSTILSQPMLSFYVRGEWQARSAEIFTLEQAAKRYVDEYPELADEFRALVAVSS